MTTIGITDRCSKWMVLNNIIEINKNHSRYQSVQIKINKCGLIRSLYKGKDLVRNVIVESCRLSPLIGLVMGLSENAVDVCWVKPPRPFYRYRFYISVIFSASICDFAHINDVYVKEN